jgi:hypothetical protein
MQTALDAYIDTLRKDIEREPIEGIAREFPELLRRVCDGSPYQLFGSETRELRPGSERQRRFFYDIYPFIEPHRFDTTPIAMMLAAGTPAIFREGKAHPSIRKVATDDIRAARVAYVELPHGSFPVGDRHQIRAVIIVPAENGTLRFTAAIGERGSNRTRHFFWHTDENSPADGVEVRGIVRKLPHHYGLGVSMIQHPVPIETVLGGRPRRIRKLLRQIETVALLAVAQYRSIVDAGGEAGLAELPHIAIADRRRSQGNRKQVARRNSFFRIRLLPHLGGIQVVAGDRKGPRLAFAKEAGGRRRLVTVRWFFRWQPYGPGRSLRRLILVQSYTRWIRDDGKAELVRLPLPDQDVAA